ncbi:MAG: hypothetical protein F4X56_00530 [Gammaproteobacteria bacterium]|nr:hypothetical protein [Gammaproteobacteria bacterium]
MKKGRQWIVACFVLVSSFAVFAEVIVPNVVGDPYEEGREYLTIEGFKVYVLPVQQYSWRGYTLEQREDERLRAIRKVTAQLKVAVSLLPPDPINELRTRVILYMDDTCEYGNERTIGKTVRTGKVYYSTLASTDGSNRKLGQVTIRCYSSFVHEYPYKGIVLHELAHAWHDLFVPNGFENYKIKTQYKWSKECLHPQQKSYWKTNAGEFFAEMSCSFFFRSRDVPHTDMAMSEKNKTLVRSAWQDPPKLDEFHPSAGSCPDESPLSLNEGDEIIDRKRGFIAAH